MSVCVAQNTNDLARDIIEVKEHVRNIHHSIETMYTHQNVYEDQLRAINNK